MSRETIEPFYDAMSESGALAGSRINASEVIGGAEAAISDPHLGFIMEDNVRAATELLTADEGSLPREAVPEAMLTLAGLLRQTGQGYRDCEWAADPDSGIWNSHVENVREGRIGLLPEELWMPVSKAVRQVKDADSALGASSPGVERVLAALNYGIYFRPETMAGAARTLTKPPEEIAEAEELEAMPHLSVANWAIAEVAQRVYERMSEDRRGSLHVVDMCSGTGATLAAITNRLAVAQDRGYGLGKGRLSMTGFEATPGFFKQLIGDFMAGAHPQWEALGIEALQAAYLAESDGRLEPGRGRLIEGDAVEGVRGLDVSALPRNDVVVATANYGFHRLPAKRKYAMISTLSQAPNSLIVVGDLRANSSRVNRGYFNLSNNGPLNAGNIGLQGRLLRNNGYRTRTISMDGFDPEYVDEALRRRLASQLKDDGFVSVAYKGPRAEQMLSA